MAATLATTVTRRSPLVSTNKNHSVASWRDIASEQTQNDLDRLLTVAVEYAHAEYERSGRLIPFGAAIANDGIPRVLSTHPTTDRPPLIEVRQSAVDALRRLRIEIRAAAVVAIEPIGSPRANELDVQLEHQAGVNITVTQDFRRAGLRKLVKWGELTARTHDPEIWESATGSG
jgi:hypothetical protein